MENEHLVVCSYCRTLDCIPMDKIETHTCIKCKTNNIFLAEIKLTEKGKKTVKKSKFQVVE